MPSEGTAEMKRRRASLRRASLCASLSRRWSRRRRRAGGTTSIPLVGNYSYKEKKKGRQNQRSTKNWNNERSFLFFPIIKRSLYLVYQALRKHHRKPPLKSTKIHNPSHQDYQSFKATDCSQFARGFVPPILSLSPPPSLFPFSLAVGIVRKSAVLISGARPRHSARILVNHGEIDTARNN